MLLTGMMLAVIMPETGFHPTPKEDRNTWQHMWYVFKQSVGAVRSPETFYVRRASVQSTNEAATAVEALPAD